MKQIVSVLIACAMFLTVLCLLPVGAAAEESNQAIIEAQEGVVKVWHWIYFYDKPSSEATRKPVYEFCSSVGSGFLIGEGGISTTAVTNNHVISTEGEYSYVDDTGKTVHTGMTLAQAYDQFVRQNGWVGWEMIARISVVNDVKINSKVKIVSEDRDYAILELEQPIYTKTSLKLRDSDTMKVTDTVYALGYPGASARLELKSSNLSMETLTVTKGAISKREILNNLVPVFQHTAVFTGGNSGGPLCSEDGAVIGINTWTDGETGGKYMFSSCINELRSALDSLGIKYQLINNAITTPIDATTAATSPAETVATVAPTSAPVATEVQTTAAAEEKDSNSILLIGLIAGGIVLIAAVVVIVILMKKKSSASAKQATIVNVQPSTEPARQTVSTASSAQYSAPLTYNPDTTVLSAGQAGETTVLNASNAGATTVHLLRVKTGEKIYLNKAVFKIGKEKSSVDYFVSDNSAVSRMHASILTKQGEYFLVDHKTTNHTYLNNEIIPGNNENKLSDGDRIKLANEEFEFKMK